MANPALITFLFLLALFGCHENGLRGMERLPQTREADRARERKRGRESERVREGAGIHAGDIRLSPGTASTFTCTITFTNQDLVDEWTVCAGHCYTTFTSKCISHQNFVLVSLLVTNELIQSH